MGSEGKTPPRSVETALEDRVASLRALSGIPVHASDGSASTRTYTKRSMTGSHQLKKSESFVLVKGNDDPLTVINTVAAHYGVGIDRLLQKNRLSETTTVRSVIMYLMSEVLGLSSARIGQMMRRDYTTVICACSRTAKRRLTDEGLDRELLEFERLLAPLKKADKAAADPPVIQPAPPPTPAPVVRLMPSVERTQPAARTAVVRPPVLVSIPKDQPKAVPPKRRRKKLTEKQLKQLIRKATKILLAREDVLKELIKVPAVRKAIAKALLTNPDFAAKPIRAAKVRVLAEVLQKFLGIS